MTPVLGIIASSIQTGAELVGSYDALASVTTSTDTTPIKFIGIPSGYKHLQLRILSRTTRSDAAVDGLYMRYNDDSSANYSFHFGINGLGSGTPTSSGTANATANVLTYSGADAQTAANIYTSYIIDILDYASTTKYKTCRSLNGYEANGSGSIMFSSGNWRGLEPITSITFTAEGSFVANSSFALYGVK